MKNAADREQVRTASRQSRQRESERLADFRTVLRMPEGRRLFGWLLEELQPRLQYWQSNAAAVGFQAARHDVGNWIKDRIDDADPDALLTMAIEGRAQAKQESGERLASS